MQVYILYGFFKSLCDKQMSFIITIILDQYEEHALRLKFYFEYAKIK